MLVHRAGHSSVNTCHAFFPDFHCFPDCWWKKVTFSIPLLGRQVSDPQFGKILSVERTILIVTAQRGNLWPRNDLAQRARTPSYKKALDWLEVEMPEKELLLVTEWIFPWWRAKKQPQHCLVATPESERSGRLAQGLSLGSRAGLGCWPMAGLKCTMQLLSRSVLVQPYLRSVLLMLLCRLRVEPHSLAVGLCPMHCSLNFSFILKHKSVFNLPQGVP